MTPKQKTRQPRVFPHTPPTYSHHLFFQVRVAIWTTTPWTIPANLAVAVNEDLDYALFSHPELEYQVLVAEALGENLLTKMELQSEAPFEKVASFKGGELAGTKYSHPLFDRTSEIVIGGDYITTDSGTGLVHTAPGHGQEDYQTGLKYNLPLLSPVDDAGKFTSEAGDELYGMSVLGDGNGAVIEMLRESGTLLAEVYFVCLFCCFVCFVASQTFSHPTHSFPDVTLHMCLHRVHPISLYPPTFVRKQDWACPPNPAPPLTTPHPNPTYPSPPRLHTPYPTPPLPPPPTSHPTPPSHRPPPPPPPVGGVRAQVSVRLADEEADHLPRHLAVVRQRRRLPRRGARGD